jgi:hypothetical protein
MKGLVLLICCVFNSALYAQQLEVEEHVLTEERPYVELVFEGELPQKGYKKTLLLKNTAGNVLFLKAVEGSCDCIKVRVRKKKLRQGQTTALLIRWKPAGDTEFSGAVSIQSNDPAYPELWIHLMGISTPPATP